MPATVRVGVGGPVGSGKTRLIERLLPLLHRDGLRVAVITNDLVTTEDAERLQASGLVRPELVVGIETGACPHTAIREDASINLAALAELRRRHSDLDVVFIESGGDNLAATFSPDLADLTLYVISVCQGEKIPRKGGTAITRSDLLIINKTDLASHVGADLAAMGADAERVRGARPFVFTDLLRRKGVDEVMRFIEQVGGLKAA